METTEKSRRLYKRFLSLASFEFEHLLIADIIYKAHIAIIHRDTSYSKVALAPFRYGHQSAAIHNLVVFHTHLRYIIDTLHHHIIVSCTVWL